MLVLATAVLRLAEARAKLTTKIMQERVDAVIECCMKKIEEYAK